MARRRRKTWAILLSIAVGLPLLALLYGAAALLLGRHQGPGEIRTRPRPAAVVRQRAAATRSPMPSPGRVADAPRTQILFGDLHVHTTFSGDAFAMSLPILQGEGAHPPADACDFARLCSGLDFWALTDHAEFLTPDHWRESIETVKACEATSARQLDQDLFSFLGWEWTQVGRTPEAHYGHRNVILRDLDNPPPRPISASAKLFGYQLDQFPSPLAVLFTPLLDAPHGRSYFDLVHFLREVSALEDCPQGVAEPDLPPTCRDIASTPADLYRKLDELGAEALVIPHGTTWGFYTPPGYEITKNISGANYDPDRTGLIEVMSGHGNSEEYRSWRAAIPDGRGGWACPEPTDDYEPCCWRAGEIIRSRCADPESVSCQERVIEARYNYVQAGIAGHLTVPGASVEDWGTCGQCTTCFVPSFNYRPGGSVQAALARADFSRQPPRHATLGLIASSDNHSARPGTGYKEIQRHGMTEATGPRSAQWLERLFLSRGHPTAASRSLDIRTTDLPYMLLADVERQASFFLTGGLVAAHVEERTREGLWTALKERRVYGTSGDRILLWFDLLDDHSGRHPMGTATTVDGVPTFEVRALGSFVPQPGCPDWTKDLVGPERLERLCRGECYNPGGRRRSIERVEVVRIRRQIEPDEPLSELIEDPWKVLPCERGVEPCTVTFRDPEFPRLGRETLYYVRALQEPTSAVNGQNLRCSAPEGGGCGQVRPCYGDYRTPYDDNCLGVVEERAWSSPIYLTPAPSALAARPRGR